MLQEQFKKSGQETWDVKKNKTMDKDKFPNWTFQNF